MAEFVIDKKMLKKKVKLTPYAIVFGIILLAYAFATMYPLIWGFMNSFKHYGEFVKYPNKFPDFSLFQNKAGVYRTQDGEYIRNVFANYLIVFDSLYYKANPAYYTGIFTQTLVMKSYRIDGWYAVLVFLWNTVLTCFAGSFMPIILCCIMAYVCAKYRYKFSTFIYGIVIFCISCPVVGRTASMLSFQKTIGVFDNMFGFFIFNANFTSMYFLIFYALYQGLPDSYIEAAEIDGASQLRVLITIAIPLAGTTIAASFVVLIITCWNDYNTPLMYLPTHPTIAYGIYYNTRQNTKLDREPIILATSMYLIIPAFLFFIFLRKQMMGNLSAGGIKG